MHSLTNQIKIRPIVHQMELLVTVVLPDMLHQIILEPKMRQLLTNVTVEVEELSKCGRSLGLNQLTLKLPCLIMHTLVAFVLHDHVVHDHTSCHHLPELVLVPCPSGVANNSPP